MRHAPRQFVAGSVLLRARVGFSDYRHGGRKVFALPGLGNYFINACFNRDEPLIIGIVAFMAIMVLAFNLLVDIAYGFIDPRIRYS
jgi:hypothetical protein